MPSALAGRAGRHARSESGTAGDCAADMVHSASVSLLASLHAPHALRALSACVLGLLTARLAVGCSYDFDAPFAAAPHASSDASSEAGSHGASDASVDTHTDAEHDASSDSVTIDEQPPPPACPAGTKRCEQDCVSIANPATGCASASCAPCAFDHGAAICVGGACALGDCEVHYGDCNQDSSDGCETFLMSSDAHCGACGNTCSWPHAQGSCNAGVCSFASCEPGWADCNNNEMDGCEVSTDSSDTDCGSCGRVCLASFHCNNSACRCSTDAQCNTGGGGVCNTYYMLCECSPYNYCQGPCTEAGNCGG